MSHQATIIAAVLLTAAAVTFNVLFMGPAVILLEIGLAVSLLAWLATGAGRHFPQPLVGPIYLASIAIQILHFSEEYTGRLFEFAPPLFNLSPLPAQRG